MPPQKPFYPFRVNYPYLKNHWSIAIFMYCILPYWSISTRNNMHTCSITHTKKMLRNEKKPILIYDHDLRTLLTYLVGLIQVPIFQSFSPWIPTYHSDQIVTHSHWSLRMNMIFNSLKDKYYFKSIFAK